MGNRPRIVKQSATQKAYTAVRELYSDIIDNLTNSECEMIIKARMDGIGRIFVVDMITQKRRSKIETMAEKSRLYDEWKQKSLAK